MKYFTIKYDLITDQGKEFGLEENFLTYDQAMAARINLRYRDDVENIETIWPEHE